MANSKLLSILSLLLILLLCLSPSVTSQEDEEDGDDEYYESVDSLVVTLTDDTFDLLVLGKKSGNSLPWLVEFYAPWCGHCKRLAPIWEELARKLQGKMNIAKIDSTAHTRTRSTYEVRGFPTIKYFRDGVVREYRGGRELSDFLKFAEKVTSPAVTKISDRFKGFTDASTSVFVISGGSDDADDNLDLVTSVAKKYQDVAKFYYDKSSQFVPKDSFVVYRTVGSNYITYKGDLNNKDDVEAFVSHHLYPLLPEMSGLNFNDLVSEEFKTVVAVVDPGNSREASEYKDIFTALADEFIDLKNLKFSWLNGVQFASFATNYVDISNLPNFFILQEDIYFSDPSAATKDDIRNFINLVISDKAEGKGEGSTFLGKSKKFLSKNLEKFADFVENNFILAAVMLSVPFLFLFYWLSKTSPSDNQVDELINENPSTAAVAASPNTTTTTNNNNNNNSKSNSNKKESKKKQ